MIKKKNLKADKLLEKKIHNPPFGSWENEAKEAKIKIKIWILLSFLFSKNRETHLNQAKILKLGSIGWKTRIQTNKFFSATAFSQKPNKA